MKTITYEEFVETFRPIKNQFNPVAPENGTLYAPIEFSRIAAATIQNRILWTVMEELVFDPKELKFFKQVSIYQGKLEGDTILGYFVTEEPYEYGVPIKVIRHSTPPSKDVIAKYDDVIRVIEDTISSYKAE